MTKKTTKTKSAPSKKPVPTKPASTKPKTTAQELEKLIHQMVVERQHHLDSISEIDQTFREFGIAAEGGKRPKAKDSGAAASKKGKASPAKTAKKTSRKGVKPGKFEVTGDQLIIDFLKSKGGATTEEIRKHWDTSGRRGKAENNLTNLVKSGKITRTKRADGPGSIYQVP